MTWIAFLTMIKINNKTNNQKSTNSISKAAINYFISKAAINNFINNFISKAKVNKYK